MQCKFRALQIQIVISVVNPLLCPLSCGFRTLQINLFRPFCQFCQKCYLISQNLGKSGMHCCHLFFIPMMDRDKPRFQYRCKWNVITVYTDLAGFREILDGKLDDVPESYFLNAGTIDEVKAAYAG